MAAAPRYGIDWYGGDGVGRPNLDAAYDAGARYAHRKALQAPYGPDTGFIEDWRLLGASKLVRGAYGFPDFTGRTPAKKFVADLKAVIDAAGGMKPGDLAVGIDIENGGKPWPLGVDGTLRYLEEIHREVHDVFAHWPMDYSSFRVIDDRDVDSLRGAPTWIPDVSPLWDKTGYHLSARSELDQHPPTGHPLTPKAWTKATSPGAWENQYQGDAIHVRGFERGTVDVNRFLGLNSSAKNDNAEVGRINWVRFLLGLDPGGWDNALETALGAFQIARSLSPDLDIGPATFAYLSRLPGRAAPARAA